MRILVIGNSRVASVFSDCLAQNKEDLVFTTSLKAQEGNFVDICPSDVEELKDFAQANEMDLTIVADTELMELSFAKEFAAANLSIFVPDPDALKIVSSRAFGKKFMYKNKLQTPKFGVFDKAQLAIEYARAAVYPLIVKADEPAPIWPNVVCKTFPKALRAIEQLFDEGAKRVVLQNFVEGKEFSYYVLTDGYNAVALDSVAKLGEDGAYLDASFVDDILKRRILSNNIKPTISALERFSTSYIGVLAIDFILTDRNELFVDDFRAFFNDLDVELFTSSVRENWAKLFNSAIVGSLLDEFNEIKKSKTCYMIAKKGDEYILENGTTLNQAKEKLVEFDDIKEVSAWKF